MDSNSAEKAESPEPSPRDHGNPGDGAVGSSTTYTLPAPASEFLFIDSGSDRARSNEAIRVHVMRGNHRARRTRRGRSSSRSSSLSRMHIWDRTSPSTVGLSESSTTGQSADDAYSEAARRSFAATEALVQTVPASDQPSAYGNYTPNHNAIIIVAD